MGAMSDQLTVGFSPLPTASRFATWHGVVRSRVLLTVLVTVLSVVIYVWQADSFGRDTVTLTIMVALVGMSWLSLFYTLAKFASARRDLARLGEGTAFIIMHQGIQLGDSLGGALLPWASIRSLRAAQFGVFRSPSLLITDTAGVVVRVPLQFLDTLPADLDNAIRTYSRGQASIDLHGVS